MGAVDFRNTVTVARLKESGLKSKEIDARAAFRYLVDEARYEHGHGGYSGTLAEKHAFRQAGTAISWQIAENMAWDFIEKDDPRYCDKWGNAGAIIVYKNKPIGHARTMTFEIRDFATNGQGRVEWGAKDAAGAQGLTVAEILEVTDQGKDTEYPYMNNYEVKAKVKNVESTGEIDGWLFFGLASS